MTLDQLGSGGMLTANITSKEQMMNVFLAMLVVVVVLSMGAFMLSIELEHRRKPQREKKHV
jgi:Tfp pilus assembly protein PilO